MNALAVLKGLELALTITGVAPGAIAAILSLRDSLKLIGNKEVTDAEIDKMIDDVMARINARSVRIQNA